MPSISKENVASYSRLFLVVVSVFCLAFIVYLLSAHSVLKSSQKGIIESYANHIYKADSLYQHISLYNMAVIEEIKRINEALLSDSLNVLGVLTDAQNHNLFSTIVQRFENIDQLREMHKMELLQDSLRLKTERVLLEGQVKNMVDLHLDKIEHEYISITLWAAILTILFLVFSFYSIYKMDELIQQGRNGVNEIKQLKAEGENRINDIARILTQRNMAYLKSLKKSTLDQNNKMLENLMDDAQGIIQEYEEKVRSRIPEFENQQQVLVNSISLLQKKIQEVNNEKNG